MWSTRGVEGSTSSAWLTGIAAHTCRRKRYRTRTILTLITWARRRSRRRCDEIRRGGGCRRLFSYCTCDSFAVCQPRYPSFSRKGRRRAGLAIVKRGMASPRFLLDTKMPIRGPLKARMQRAANTDRGRLHVLSAMGKITTKRRYGRGVLRTVKNERSFISNYLTGNMRNV